MAHTKKKPTSTVFLKALKALLPWARLATQIILEVMKP